jgi:hypothetical protein
MAKGELEACFTKFLNCAAPQKQLLSERRQHWCCLMPCIVHL